jgi:glycosyltransferase involved in cell wall biosynthesis
VTLGRPLVWRVANLLKWSQWQLPSRVWRARVDVLHSVNYDVPLLRRCPVVQTIHDVAQLTFTQFHPTRWHWLYWSVWGPLSMHVASHVVTVSEFSKQDIMRHLRIPEPRISVVYNGVDARFRVCGQPSQLHDLRRRYLLPSQFILFVGAVRPFKGVDTLIAAFARLADAWPEVGLAVAGGYGVALDAAMAQAAQAGVAARVRFLGHVPDDELVLLYNAATVLAHPSRFEGFGLTVLEAMACGTPVVCSTAASLPEVAGDAALLVPADDPEALAAALDRLLRDADLRHTLRAAGLARAALFSWDECASKTLAVYEGVVDA